MFSFSFSKSARLFCVAGVSALSLTGCMLDSMEKITEETRDEVHATNQAIHQGEEMQKIARMHGLMIDADLSPSVRVDAAKAVLAKYPIDRLASNLGMIVPDFKRGSYKKNIGGAEIELLNVPYVGKKISKTVGVTPINADLFEIVSTAAVTLTSELEAKSKMSGLSGDEIQLYREVGARLALIVPAILGAAALEPLEQAIAPLIEAQLKGTLPPGSFSEQVQTNARGFVRAIPGSAVTPTLKTLEQLAVNVSLDESTLTEMRALISLRLGIN
jgi:hypothetical protein